MKQVFLTRQMDIIKPSILNEEIQIIGSGAIGSFTALSLAKMGFENITVWDFDMVDDVNLNCQFFRVSDIGKPKVEALKEIIQDFTGTEIKTKNEAYEGQVLSGIVITALDNMKTRKLILDSNRGNIQIKRVIDPRMSAEYATMQMFDPGEGVSMSTYEKTLFDDDNSVQERCTAKSTMYTVNLIAGMVSKTVKNVLSGDKYMKGYVWDIGQNDLNCFVQ